MTTWGAHTENVDKVIAPEPMTTLPPINLEQIEQLVYSRRYEDAGQELFSIIQRLKQGAGFTFYAKTHPSVPSLFTRLASAITSMFADPTFALSYEGFIRFVSDHPMLHSIFRASAYGSMDYALALVGRRKAVDSSAIEFTGDANIPKLLLCWSLESEIDLDFPAMAAQAPQWVVPALVGYMSIGGIHTQRAYDRKVQLMRLWPLLETTPFTDLMITPAGDCYMHCSYVDIPEKHEMKKALNRQLRKLVLEKMPVAEAVRGTLTRQDRPTVVVPVEWFGSHHAMYRCYAPSIAQLRQKFRVVGIGRPDQVDEEGKKAFDKYIALPDGSTFSLGDMVKIIGNEKPDIIWYPSIGMASWWVALSNFRLAPIQVMSPGHPATTHSGVIDYILSDGDLFGDERHYDEKCVHMPVGGARYIGREFDKMQARAQHKHDGIVRVAISAMVMKLTPPFLSMAQRIREQVKVPVEFHFFPNQVATGHYLITNDLRAWVPDAVVHERATYQDYCNRLARCDLMLSTFPFGGTNSVIDAFLLGLPMVTLEGDQIHSRSDASMIRRVGLPESLITHSVEEYEKAAVSLIVNDVGRQRLRNHLLKTNIEAEFFGEGPEHVRDAFLKAFETVYEGELNGQ